MSATRVDHFRMYADSNGDSHFQDLTFGFEAVDATIGRRQYVIVLSGEFELEDLSGKGHCMRVPADAEVCVAF